MKVPTLTSAHRMGGRQANLIPLAAHRTGGRQANLIALVPIGAIVTFPVWLAPARIVVKEFSAAEVIQLLTVLFLAAVLAERALEIFVGTWRTAAATQLELTVHGLEEDVARLSAESPVDQRAVADARAALDKARRQERQYRCGTRQAALRVGLALGLLVSGVGLRALETFIDPALSGWSANQSAAFRLVDVLLTGGVIAGGSEGIHRIATVFDNFLSSTARRAKSPA
jgi:hypothetical protein